MLKHSWCSSFQPSPKWFRFLQLHIFFAYTILVFDTTAFFFVSSSCLKKSWCSGVSFCLLVDAYHKAATLLYLISSWESLWPLFQIWSKHAAHKFLWKWSTNRNIYLAHVLRYGTTHDCLDEDRVTSLKFSW